MRYGPQGSIYQLILEARSPSGGSVQQYPFSFRLTSTIERTDVPPSAPITNAP